MRAAPFVRSGALHFALVFGAGFVLGPVRVLWVAPRLGERAAELLETPIMLAVIVLAARWVSRRLAVPATGAARLGMGLVALGLLLAAELAVVLRLRGLTIREYVASRDPIAGAAYVALLVVFALAPVAVARR